jgi:hypothetical protein
MRLDLRDKEALRLRDVCGMVMGVRERTAKVKRRDRVQRERRVRVYGVSVLKKGYWRIFESVKH